MTLFSDKDQLNNKDPLLLPAPIPHALVKASPERDKDEFLKMEIASRECRNTTGTLLREETTKFFSPNPQAPKKLHSLTSKE
jgi:hypothetical protein